MRSIVLFEDEGFVNLLPLVYWRSVFELRVGRSILMDQTTQRLGLPIAGVWTRDWIARVAAQRCGAPANQAVTDDALLVNGRWEFDEGVELPEEPGVGTIGESVAYVACDRATAERLAPRDLLDPARCRDALNGLPRHAAPGRMIRYPWDIVCSIADRLRAEWRDSDAAMETTFDAPPMMDQPERIHIGERASVHSTAVIDTSNGPVFVSHDVTIGPYAVIEGPAYIGPGSRISPHAHLHGGNALGPVCNVGGEVDACVIGGYANKRHGGFLGHTYVGSWVNLGAGSVNSDLKNTYGLIRVPVNGTTVDTGEQFFGAIIGDHAKIGINATIPTGASIGLSATAVTTRVLPKYVPSFGWVTNERVGRGDPLRLLDVATAMMARRDVDMTDAEVELFIDLGQQVRDFESRPKADW